MVDAEFAVQFLVLSQGAHPELVPNVGNIALLQRAQACGLCRHRRGARRGQTPTASCAACSTCRSRRL
jgi:glutamate-ammonia-ligase adenylyltransferase